MDFTKSRILIDNRCLMIFLLNVKIGRRTLMAQEAALTFRAEDKRAVKLKQLGFNGKISYKVSLKN